MKIVCESCGAKYSIADEKVAGKVFKIRCKKCSAVIVVRGDELTGSETEAGQGSPTGEDPNAVWYVVVEGEQQGPYTPDQLSAMMQQGVMDWESYVWRDGFEGWVAARDASELTAALGGVAEPAAPAAAEPAPAISAGAGSFGEDPFAPSNAPGPQLAEESGTTPGMNTDLFAQASAEPSPFDVPAPQTGGVPVAAGAGGTPQPVAGADGAAGSMTGRRSENSVLFSLSNLQALAAGSENQPAKKAAPGPSSASNGESTTDGSGLIDIRALASTTQTTGSGGSSGSENIDDLLSIGTGSALASSLTAPVLGPSAEEEKSSNRTMILLVAFLGFAIIVAGGVVAAVLLLRTPVSPPVAVTPPEIAPAQEETKDSPDEEAAAAAADEDKTPEEEQDDAAEQAAAAETSARSERRPDRAGTTRRSRTEETRTRTAMETSMAAAPAPSMASSSSMLNIDQLIHGATSMSGSSMQRGPDPSLPESPSRSQVASALRAVSGQVRACGNGQHGQAMVAVVVAGATGRVQSANVQGQFAGTPVGACIQRAVRGARFPRFQRRTFTVNFPYVL